LQGADEFAEGETSFMCVAFQMGVKNIPILTVFGRREIFDLTVSLVG
jgi:hypothetical protein